MDIDDTHWTMPSPRVDLSSEDTYGMAAQLRIPSRLPRVRTKPLPMAVALHRQSVYA